MAANSNGANAPSLPIILFVVFLVMKLAHVIKWSWWWVTCPLWAVPAFLIGLSVLFLTGSVLTGLYRLIFWSKKKRTEHRSIRKVIKALEDYANALSERNS